VPRTNEFRFDEIWPLQMKNPRLVEYFPDYPEGEMPGRSYFFDVILKIIVRSITPSIKGKLEDRFNSKQQTKQRRTT
jgi:hypothetical protein